MHAALAVPRIEPEQVVRVLGAATTLALAAGAERESAVAPLLAAIDLLAADFQGLRQLIEEGDEQALRASARLAGGRAADLAELLEREREPLARLELAPRESAWIQRAPELARQVRELAGEVEATFAVPASELAPGSLKVDRGELRRLLAGSDDEALVRMVEPGLPRPAGVAASAPECGEALTALREWLEQPEPEPAPLPQPRRLQVEPIDVVPDFVELAAQALTWLAGLGDATLDKWVVGGSWSQASARMAAAVEAWSRWGPAGDSSLAADLDPRPQFELIGRDEVAVTTRTGVLKPVTETPAEAEQEAAAGPEAEATAPGDPAAADPPAPEEPTP